MLRAKKCHCEPASYSKHNNVLRGLVVPDAINVDRTVFSINFFNRTQ